MAPNGPQPSRPQKQMVGLLEAGVFSVLTLAAVSLGACRPRAEADVASARSLGVMEQSPAIAGRDGGRSFLAWGRSIWTYGDTVLFVQDEYGHSWHHNSVSAATDLDASDGITGFVEPLDPAGAPAHLIAPTAEELAFNLAHQVGECDDPARWAVWPGDGVYDEARDRVLIMYELIYAEPGDFTFHAVGSSVAVWESFDATPERPVIDPGQEHPTLLFQDPEPTFLNGAVILDDHLHTFACPSKGLEHPCILGRAPLDQVLERSAWEFWDGDRFGPNWRDAKDLFQGSSIMSVAWNDYLQRFIAVYSEPLANRVKLRTARRLTGPWSYEERLFTAQAPAGDGCIYDATLHSEYSEQGGKVLYVSHSRLTGEGFLEADMLLWRVVLE